MIEPPPAICNHTLKVALWYCLYGYSQLVWGFSSNNKFVPIGLDVILTFSTLSLHLFMIPFRTYPPYNSVNLQIAQSTSGVHNLRLTTWLVQAFWNQRTPITPPLAPRWALATIMAAMAAPRPSVLHVGPRGSTIFKVHQPQSKDSRQQLIKPLH
jgi:hypothetical protein